VDVAQLYDCFTSVVLVTLEDYGFCGRGEAGPLALDGGLGPDGKIPTNTSGGMLSEANVAGWNHVIEAVRQLLYRVRLLLRDCIQKRLSES
ncbi:MAG: thiolase C-terminal domain-containing protein, partial [Planctomycetota bacterium]